MTIDPRAAVALVSLLCLGLGAAAPSRADELEALEASGAAAQVASSRGVVLVDLYADW